MTRPVLVSLGSMFPGGNTGQGGLTAAAAGTQAAATPLPATVNEVAVVAGADDSVLLPSAVAGAVVLVYNFTATEIAVFGQASNGARISDPDTGDVIVPAATSTPAATATGVTQPAHALAIYVCARVGVWKQGLMVS